MPSSKCVGCAYIKRDGLVCDKKCYGGICWAHARCGAMRRCRLCGRGTQSASGICHADGACRKAQHNENTRLNVAAKRAPLCAAELDALLDELLQ